MKYLIGLLIFGVFNLNAQTIRINEVVSSNSVYIDEDGDTPDWLELHNYGTEDVSINGWTLSDDIDDLAMWTFPDITLSSDEYLLIWASSKDRSLASFTRTLINQGDAFKYSIPTSEPSSNWTTMGFDDISWFDGNSGFGYADGDDVTILPNGTQSVYLRKIFEITDLDEITSLILDMDYDDAFVAYINGIEIARANINGSPPLYNSGTILGHEAQIYNGGTPERFLITDFNTILNEGENILSIQAHNISSGSSDFTIIPFLSVVYSSPNNSGIEPPEVLNLTSNNLHTNFKISSGTETLTLSDDSGILVDQITAENLPPNTSIGVSITTSNIVSYLDTTPGYINSNNEFLGAVQSEVVFSEVGGLIDSPLNLILSGNNAGEMIRYEIGGLEPSETSPIYTNPIEINSNTTVRAKIFLNNYLPSSVFTESYIIGSNHNIDVVLLSVNPDDFFDENNGMYVFGPDGTYDPNVPYYGANFWEDWERPIHFAFYDNETDNFAEYNAGVKIFGGWSRGQNGQKSLSLFARGQYGDSKFEHAFFDQLPYDDFEALVLRSSGQDWMRSSMKDIMLTSLMRDSGLDFQEHNPVATYLNGTYWGMYNLREKTNEHMLASKHNIDADDITILTNNAEEIEGSNEEYIQLINYINTSDLTLNSNFEYVDEQVDIKQYALYQASNIFFNNIDWPGNNIKYWKHPDGKWRWIMFDTDFGFGTFWNTANYTQNTLDFALEENGPSWPNPPWATLMFRKLITNIGFRNIFINRYADELNTRFLPENIIAHIDEIYASIEPEVQAHYERWRMDPSLTNNGVNITDIGSWVGFYVSEMKNFANNRHPIVKEHIKSQFSLPDFHPLTITNLDIAEGSVEVNENLNIQESSWTGDYFETVPIQLTAIAEQGFEFSHWSGDLSLTNETITIDINGSFEIIPNFIPSETLDPIVINEINYKSINEFNADDWVELYNPNTTSVDLSNWEIKDDDDTHIFIIPDGTSIEAEGYLVFVKDASDFSSVFPDISNYIGELGFGFGGSDSVRLFNANNILQDEVAYLSVAPWLDCADETGNTLELITPDLDNTLPESWDCINTHGSPNAINTSNLSLTDFDNNSVKVYPNPVQNILHISGAKGEFNIHVYSTLGQLVLTQTNIKDLDLSHFNNGVYYIKIYESNKISTLSIIKY